MVLHIHKRAVARDLVDQYVMDSDNVSSGS